MGQLGGELKAGLQQVAQAAQEAGIGRPRLVWVLQGPDRVSPDRVRRLNSEVFSGVANTHGDLVSDAGWHVSMAAYPYETVADGRYKWVQSAQGSGLFDLSNDVGEKTDLSQTHPDVLERVRGRWRWHLLLRTTEPARLTRLVGYMAEHAPVPSGVRMVIDRDPVALL